MGDVRTKASTKVRNFCKNGACQRLSRLVLKFVRVSFMYRPQMRSNLGLDYTSGFVPVQSSGLLGGITGAIALLENLRPYNNRRVKGCTLSFITVVFYGSLGCAPQCKLKTKETSVTGEIVNRGKGRRGKSKIRVAQWIATQSRRKKQTRVSV
ncbi:hypothetical protein EDB84DRAFT_263984 [Lactarius hengduanensis]|nr:hypothetical protein EDB84DRAFT_263984 [Lactarius hengduanensis]